MMSHNSEKPAEKPCNFLNACLHLLRLFQWASCFYVYVSLALLFQYTLIRDSRVRSIQTLIFITLTYSTFVTLCILLLANIKRLRVSSWHVFAVCSILGDLVMLCLFIAKLAIFSIRYFECSLATRTTTSSHEYAFMRRTGEKLFALLGGSNIAGMSGIPSQCYFPFGVYGISIAIILSCVLSMIFTMIQLRRHWRAMSTVGAGPHPGHVEQAIRSTLPRSEMTTWQSSSMPQVLPSIERHGSNTQIAGSSGASDEDPKYANMPMGIVAGMVIARRMSQETTSSFNPDLYLVSDGFRPDDPPGYSSRPPSLGPPQYTSRPTSMYDVA